MTSKATKLLNLGINIRNARKLKHLSQNALAEKLDISREHLAKIETAKRCLSLDLLFRIADILDISESSLLDFNEL